MDDVTERRLLSTPVRRINFNLLSEYTWSANGSNDQKFSSDELRHFLPRYLHFIAYGLFPNFGGEWEPTLRQLGLLNYRENWSNAEIRAIDDYFAALFDHYLAQPVRWHTNELGNEMSWSDTEDILCTIANGGGDLNSQLLDWDNQNQAAADQNLAYVIERCSQSQANGDTTHGLWNPFWDRVEDGAIKLRRWLYRPETVARLDRAISPDNPANINSLLARARDAVLTNLENGGPG